MRRKRQKLQQKDAYDILLKNKEGVLALNDEYAYALPINYFYDQEQKALFFHGAKEGKKLDLIKKDPKASFCVIDKKDIVKEEYTTYFKSVIVYGKIEIIEDKEELKSAITKMAKRFFPEDDEDNRNYYIEKDFKQLMMFKLKIKEITGKCAIELLK
ncbi:MAG: pyridoxamine 5'-phosphate oxidase family protein [Tissierellia bacterium]|nr:pyridoxamine 5'-phosphate oxidase family protein [Tissierellia bacterium]